MRLHMEFLVQPRIIKGHKKINWITQITFEKMAIPVWNIRKGKTKNKPKIAKALMITHKSFKLCLL